jgi:hypothetical protein
MMPTTCKLLPVARPRKQFAADVAHYTAPRPLKGFISWGSFKVVHCYKSNTTFFFFLILIHILRYFKLNKPNNLQLLIVCTLKSQCICFPETLTCARAQVTTTLCMRVLLLFSLVFVLSFKTWCYNLWFTSAIPKLYKVLVSENGHIPSEQYDGAGNCLFRSLGNNESVSSQWSTCRLPQRRYED